MEQPQRLTLLHLPSLYTNSQHTFHKQHKHSFESFIFKDNFTKNKILLKDLALKNKSLLNQSEQSDIKHSGYQPSNFKKRFGCRQRQIDIPQELKQLSSNIIIFKNTKNFQVTSLKERDSHYKMPINMIDQIKTFNENLKEKSKFSKLRNSLNNRQSAWNISNSLNNNRYRESVMMQNSRSSVMMRNSKRSIVQIKDKFENECGIGEFSQDQYAQEYKMTFQDKQEINGGKKKNEQENELTRNLRNQQTEFLKKMKFHLKRTLIQNGQYLVKPDLNQFKKINLFKIEKQYQQQYSQYQQYYNKNKIIINQRALQLLPQKSNIQHITLNNHNIKLKPEQKVFFNSIKKDDIFQIMYLLEKNPNLVKSTDKKGNNALHYSAKVGNIQTFIYLYNKGVSLDQKNNINKTPLEICEHFGYKKIGSYFQNRKNLIKKE